MVHESHLLVLQQVNIDNNERELANKVKQEEDIMHQIMRPDESEDGVNQDKLDQNYNTHVNTTQIKAQAHARKHISPLFFRLGRQESVPPTGQHTQAANL